MHQFLALFLFIYLFLNDFLFYLRFLVGNGYIIVIIILVLNFTSWNFFKFPVTKKLSLTMKFTLSNAAVMPKMRYCYVFLHLVFGFFFIQCDWNFWILHYKRYKTKSNFYFWTFSRHSCDCVYLISYGFDWWKTYFDQYTKQTVNTLYKQNQENTKNKIHLLHRYSL